MEIAVNLTSLFKLCSVAALSLLAGTGCSSGKARVAFASPMGLSSSPVMSISVMFDREIVTDLELGEEIQHGPFTISPALDGTFRWEQPDEVVFTPKFAVAEGQEHKVALDSTVLAQDGSPLDTYGWTFAWNHKAAALLDDEPSAPADLGDDDAAYDIGGPIPDCAAYRDDATGADRDVTADGGVDDVCP